MLYNPVFLPHDLHNGNIKPCQLFSLPFGYEQTRPPECVLWLLYAVYMQGSCTVDSDSSQAQGIAVLWSSLDLLQISIVAWSFGTTLGISLLSSQLSCNWVLRAQSTYWSVGPEYLWWMNQDGIKTCVFKFQVNLKLFFFFFPSPLSQLSELLCGLF